MLRNVLVVFLWVRKKYTLVIKLLVFSLSEIWNAGLRKPRTAWFHQMWSRVQIKHLKLCTFKTELLMLLPKSTPPEVFSLQGWELLLLAVATLTMRHSVLHTSPPTCSSSNPVGLTLSGHPELDCFPPLLQCLSSLCGIIVVTHCQVSLLLPCPVCSWPRSQRFAYFLY